MNGNWKRRLLTHGRPHGGYGNKTGTTNNKRIDVVCILGTSQIQDLDPSRVVCVLCSFSTLSLTHAPALYSYGLLASPGTDMPYPGSYGSIAVSGKRTWLSILLPWGCVSVGFLQPGLRPPRTSVFGVLVLGSSELGVSFVLCFIFRAVGFRVLCEACFRVLVLDSSE